jgi:glutamine phosphoribosylpyrophosphate amidotransferase
MCAVIGVVLKSPTKEDFQMIKRVFLESKVRGMHATGMSYLPKWNKEIVTIKESRPANEFVDIHLHDDNLKDMVNSDGILYLIGHCRYSTSDLEYNQPIANNTKSIVHNGVITQELPEFWKQIYGYDCMTKNDSELILHSSDPLTEFSHMSMGAIELTSDRKVKAYRNGKRPLYLTSLVNGCIITSTSNIIDRARVVGVTTDIPMNTYVTFDENLTMHLERKVVADAVDYQNYEPS